ncbi:hypothetical protein [Xanthomonas phage RTH11]|nr:hypothetical protein [Xanthomonas phage RTH11]
MNDAVAETSEVEQLRVQLAGCGVVAMCNTRETLKQQMPSRESFGYSQSLQEVHDGVLREINERERAGAYREAIEKIAPLANKETLMALASTFHDGPYRDPQLVEILHAASQK